MSPTLSLLFVAFTYSLIWLPQIIRSVRKVRGSGLEWEYVVGVTAGRVWFLLCEYFLTLFCNGQVLIGYVRFACMPQECAGCQTTSYVSVSFPSCPSTETLCLEWSYLLAAFISLQGLIVILQDWISPTFFIPSRVRTAVLSLYMCRVDD